MQAIDEFRGKYRFLSNFYLVQVRFEGIAFRSSEHAFQAAKTRSKEARKTIAACTTPGQAKRMGRVVPLRPDWEDIKDLVMLDILRDKFYPDSLLANNLVKTSPAILIEGNWHRDRYWGAVVYSKLFTLRPTETIWKGNGKDWIGRNQLGITLMQIREELIND